MHTLPHRPLNETRLVASAAIMPDSAIPAEAAADRALSYLHPRLRFLLPAALLPFLLASCLTGGGRYQKKMGTGRTFYHEPVFPWQPGTDRPIKAGMPLKNTSLSYCRWLPPAGMRTRGIVIAVPGLDESCVEWTRMGLHLAGQGYEVYSSDLRGQGKDYITRSRGNYHNWKQWVRDVNDFAHQMLALRRLPVAYVGQSLGALIAAAAAAEAHDTGYVVPKTVVLHSPALALAYPPGIARPAVGILQVLTLNLPRATSPAILERRKLMIMSNPADEEAWETSPDRVSKGFTLRYLSSCLAIGGHVRGGVPSSLTMPVLIQYGKSDPAMAMSKLPPDRFCDLLANPDSRIWEHPHPAANHDMLNDRHMRGELLRVMTGWLNQKI